MKSLKDFLGESRTKAGLEAEKKGLIHTGKGYYADAKGNIVAKAEGGSRLIPLSPEEKQRLKSGEPLTTPPMTAGQMPAGGQQSPAQQQVQQEPQKETPKDEKTSEEEPMVPRNEGGGSVVITFGRFNPPHTGHLKLLDKVADEAYKDGSDYMIYPSQSQDPKKNPLDFGTKTNVMQTMFPHHASNIVNDPSGGRNIFDVLKGLHAQGYDNVKIVVGDDRVKEFTNITGKYNGKTYNFGKLDIVSAGERDPDSEDVEGMSASKMRKAAQDNDYDSFKKGLPTDVKSADAKAIYMQVRRSMNLEEELYQIAPKLDQRSLREEYYQENIFSVGDLVESLSTGIVGNIIFRGSNYVIILDEEGRTFRTWLDNITEKVHWEVGTDIYRIAVQKLTPGQPVVSYAHKDPSTLNSIKKKSKNGTI
jgi:nicotinic acid mononucleotide adenylyltransferase